MRFSEIISMAMQSLGANKLRSGLTMVGITIGVFSVISVMTAIGALQASIESGISFLGLGVQPPEASLGSLLHDGRVYLSVAPWLVFVPGIVLAITILSVNLVGDGLRRTIDPLIE